MSIAKADTHKLTSLPPMQPYQELLFQFDRTGRGRTYRARFLESDHQLAPVLAKAEQEGLIRRTTRSKKIVGFITSKGSTYELNGTATRRFKKVTGVQYGFSMRTVYLTKEATRLLLALRKSRGIPELRGDELWVDFAKQRERGFNHEDEKVEFSESPAKGLHPFEEMSRGEQGHRRWHIGHEIVDLDAVRVSVDGYVDFQLTPRGLSELRRFQQQVVDRLGAVSGIPAPLG